jgi:hypothetical protein
MNRILVFLLFSLSAPVWSYSQQPADRDTKVSLDIPDADLKSALRQLADLYHLDLVIPDSIVGRTSVKLRDVTWPQALKVLLEPIGWTYRIDGQVIVLERAASVAQTEQNRDTSIESIFAIQSSVAKSALRDADYAEALAEFHWNFYTALMKKGFTKEQAMRIVTEFKPHGESHN